MTTHPEPQILAAFLDGTLDDATRREVADHIETCDECLTVIGETARMLDEEEAVENVVPMHGAAAATATPPAAPAAARPPRRPRPRPWMYLAAAIAIIAISAMFLRTLIFRDPVDDLIRASRSLATRPVEGRLAGFDYAPYRVPRSVGDDDEIDSELVRLQSVAGDVIEKNASAARNARRQHAAGVAALMSDGHRDDALPFLIRATELDPHNARYWNDLAVAWNDARRHRDALRALERAIQIDASDRAARFNLAVTYERLGDKLHADAAYSAYLTLDPSSPWAEDARRDRERLRGTLRTR
jgi:tetratricopeptide (TPR) repeat protein